MYIINKLDNLIENLGNLEKANIKYQYKINNNKFNIL